MNPKVRTSAFTLFTHPDMQLAGARVTMKALESRLSTTDAALARVQSTVESLEEDIRTLKAGFESIIQWQNAH